MGEVCSFPRGGSSLGFSRAWIRTRDSKRITTALATGQVTFASIREPYDELGDDEIQFSAYGLDNVVFAAASAEVRLAASRESAVASQRFTVDVTVGENAAPVADLFGVSFDIDYDALQIQFVNFIPDLSFVDCDDDPDTEDHVLVIRPTDGRVSVAVSRRADRCLEGAAGDTRVGQFVFEVPSAVPGGSVSIAPSDITLVQAAGTDISARPVGDTIEIIDGVVVWPGDTDQSGAVTSADILPIGAAFGEFVTARETADRGVQWRGVLAPLGASAADADGDGEIDEGDVLAIGVNYGREVPGDELARLSLPPVASIEIAPQPVGSEIALDLEVAADGVLGIAMRLVLPPTLEVVAVMPGAWLDDGDLLTFDSAGVGYLDAAATRKQGAEITSGEGTALEVRVRVVAEMAEPATIEVERLTLGTPDGQRPAESGAVRIGSPFSTASETLGAGTFSIAPPRPNPTSSRTGIEFETVESGLVRVSVYDALGREVAVLIDGTLPAGAHRADLDASRLTAGVYVIRLVGLEGVASTRLTVAR